MGSSEHNLELNAKDLNGQTALQWALSMCHLDVAAILFQESAESNIELNVKDIIGRHLFIGPAWWVI